MSTTSPQKRRATALRSSMLDQPMRQTRSMARISDMMEFSELPSTSRLSDHHHASSSTSSNRRDPSPRKARASQAAELESFDPDSPDVSMAPCMESPKKGRFDDFEFELETSNPEVPTRRRRIAPPRQSSTSPPADVGLPRSKTSTTLARSGTRTNNTLLTSRKENSPSAPTEQSRAGASPIKPVAALPRVSRLHGPALSARASSQAVAATSDTKATNPNRSDAARPIDGATSQAAPVAISRDSGNRLLFDTTDVKPDASAKRNPFLDSADSTSLAMLGEPRHSPVKRFQAKTEFIILSPDRPDRKPINLLELKPSPGKAQRGIFRHNSAQDDDEDDDDDWDASGSNTVDEIRLVKGPAPKRHEAASSEDRSSSASSDTAPSTKTSSSTEQRTIPRSTTTLDVKHTLSTETSDALASLEASLARLKAKTRSPPTLSSATSSKKESNGSADSAPKRELGTARPTGMTSSRTQIFRTKSTMGSDSSFSARSTTADQSSDSSVFKRPSGRVSALAKVRSSGSDTSTSMLASSKSMMSFGAPRLPGFSELGARTSSRPVAPGSRLSSLEMVPNDARAEEHAAQEEEEARVAEAKRQAELKAAKRKSMSSILSSGMPPPLHRKVADASKIATNESRTSSTRSSSSSSSRTPSSAAAAAPEHEPTEAELAEARKAAKAARRRSLYTYVPPKREDTDGDRSVGNVSAGLVVTSSTGGVASAGDASAAAPRKARFLRGLTVLVDVRDQDGEDASACWIDMLKNAGAKVMVRFGERKITHIVYKSGRPSTLHSYRALDDPKPHVVGIGWVVACLEQATKADETPYLVEVAKQAIFATRRRSLMAPKQAPSSANIAIRELPKEKLKDVQEARRKLLAHAPAVPSPLRRKISSTTILASQLAGASIGSSPSRSDKPCDDVDDKNGADVDKQDDALMEAYRQRVGSVLTQRSAVFA